MWQIVNDCIDSLFSNGIKIIRPAITKTLSTAASYLITNLTEYKVISLEFDAFLRSTRGKAMPYCFVAYAWGETVYSILCADPTARASHRRYTLK